MNIKWKIIFIFPMLFFFVVYQSSTESIGGEGNKPCERNYIKEGSSFFTEKGMEEKTWMKYNDVSLQKTLKAAIAATSNMGWALTYVDKDKGILNAWTTHSIRVSPKKFNITEVLIAVEIKPNRPGSLVEIKTVVFQPGYRADIEMCKYLETVEKTLKSY